MTVRFTIVLIGAAAFGFGCMAWVGNCTARATCSGTADHEWIAVLQAALPTIAIMLAVCAARCGYLLWRTSRRLATFETVAPADKLKAAMDAADVIDVRCLVDLQALAFCSGALKPRIYVTTGLLRLLTVPELEAVLRHEEHHRQGRHPLLRSLLSAATDVMFFFPVLGWLAGRILDDAELAADRAAIRRLGHQTVAAALWRVGTPTIRAPGQATAFGGAVELRTAQLLGDELPARRPAARLWFQSIVGMAVVLVIGMCALGTAY